MQKDSILVLNAGSSSIKFALFPLSASADDALTETPVVSGQIDGIGAHPVLTAKTAAGKQTKAIESPNGEPVRHQAALDALLQWLTSQLADRTIVAVGHRVVHGGELFSAPTKITPTVLAQLEQFTVLAPLHQPHNLAGIQAIYALLPGVPQVACFDTAFHRTMPRVAEQFGLPRALTEEGVKRYGFHGLSYEYIARQLPGYLEEDADGRTVICHLGNGASMAALRNRQSVASTMGFTALEGLMMGTRTGSLDPGVLLYLMDVKGMSAKQLTQLLYKESGLLGVSGISQDMRELLASEAPAAKEAVDLFCYRIIRELGSLMAAIGGLDTLVFTGGIGEHAAPVRAAVCQAFQWMGLQLDAAANAENASWISRTTSKVDVLVIPTNEEWMIAEHTLALTAGRHVA